MSLTTFSTALSGLNANAQGLSVVGNNLANLNTVGFKGSNINFIDVMGQAFAGGVSGSGNVNLGLGTAVSSIRPSFTTGGLQTTNNPLDVAIQGKGLLVLNSANGKFYTRAGNLHLDANNNLVAENGMNVQGFARNPLTGNVDPNLGVQSIQLPANLQTPIKTSFFNLTMNLDANAPNGTQYTTTFQIYDSVGTAHIAKLNMVKDISTGATPTTQWRFDITIPEKEIAGASATSTADYSLLAGAVATNPPNQGALVFDSGGKLTSAYFGSGPAPATLADLQIPPTGVTLPTMRGGATLNPGITWQLLNPSDNSPAVSGYASPSDVTFSTQNGMSAGALNNLTVLPDGTIAAVFTNGQTVDFAQIVLAQFGNVDGLVAVGGGLYQESVTSGASFVGAPGSGGRGVLIGGALEQSNVDLATELTKIITFQRGYQANAKMITTTDQIMQQTMNMTQ
jgi:flagellar hook protein FlgE